MHQSLAIAGRDGNETFKDTRHPSVMHNIILCETPEGRLRAGI